MYCIFNKGSEERITCGGWNCGRSFRGSWGLDWALKDKQEIYRHKGEKGRPRSETMVSIKFLMLGGSKVPPYILGSRIVRVEEMSMSSSAVANI